MSIYDRIRKILLKIKQLIISVVLMKD